MGKSKSRRYQKLYKMRGCSKKRCKTRKTYKNHLGGSTGADMNLAYTGKPVPTNPNPFLAYTGKGGASHLAKAYPSTGPTVGPDGKGTNWINPPAQRGGQCGSCGLMKGGQCGSCGLMKGGGGMSNNGIPYPDGLVGKPWSPNNLPGLDNTSGGSNYYKINNYANDISRQMQSIGANPPFDGKVMKGGKRKKCRKQRGGTLSNFLGQDLINLGSQFKFGAGSAYNAMSGYPSPVNPLPWKGQLPTTANINTIQAVFK